MNTITVNMDGAALGVMGEAGDVTVVRPTTDGRFVVMKASTGRIIKVFTEAYPARLFNAAIHGEML